MNAAFLFCRRRRTQICLALAFTMLSCVIVGNAQTPRTLSSTGRRLDEFNRQSEKVARDELDREMHGRKPTEVELRQAAAKKVEIREDFENLQAAYNEIVTKLRAKQPLNDTYVSDVSGKIAKSGSRLRHNIEFPEKNGDGSKPKESTQPPASLTSLCLLLHAFLTSPVFETGVLDVIEAGKARDNLDKIILNAESLHQKLGKTN
jgi:hypothetical protein